MPDVVQDGREQIHSRIRAKVPIHWKNAYGYREAKDQQERHPEGRHRVPEERGKGDDDVRRASSPPSGDPTEDDSQPHGCGGGHAHQDERRREGGGGGWGPPGPRVGRGGRAPDPRGKVSGGRGTTGEGGGGQRPFWGQKRPEGDIPTAARSIP